MPPIYLRLAARIDRFSDLMGRYLCWLTLFMVVIGSWNAVARKTDRFTGLHLSSNAFIELQWYMFSVIFLLGAAYTLRHGEHVRVDVLYGRLPAKAQAWINFIGTLIFLFPFCALMIWVSMPSVINSWKIWEISNDPGGLPRYPLKTMVPLAFLLLAVQGLSELFKNLAVILGHAGDAALERDHA